MSPEEPSLSPYAGLAKRIRPHGSTALDQYQAAPPQIVIRRGGQKARFVLPTPGRLIRSAASMLFALQDVEVFRVLLDNEELGPLGRDETLRAEIPAGEHRLTVREDGWFFPRSKSVRLKIENGQTFYYLCLPAAFSLILNRVD